MNIDKYGRSELHYAALEGNAEKVRALIQSGALVNLQCKQGWAALHCAAQANCSATASLLIEAGADLELRDVFGNTPLWRATMASNGNGGVIKLLLGAGANPNAANKSGVSPVSLANTIGNHNVLSFMKSPNKSRHLRPSAAAASNCDAVFRACAQRYTNMMKTIIFTSIVLLANVCASATLEEVYSHEYGVWSIESNDKLSKRVIIHNIMTAKEDNIFHIEVVGTEDPQQPWRVTRLKSHLAIKPEVLAPSLISPLSKGKVYPEHFNFEFEAWQKQQIKIICTTELFKCIK